MEINRSNINEIVRKSNGSPDKDYGQNFLLEPNIASEIVEALDIQKGDNVLEIGPGLGSLTHFLAQKGPLTVCDIDERMISFLKVVYPENVEFILNDIRKVDVRGYNKIIGNLPYNITTELVVFLLLNARSFKRMVLMCQQEAFNRFFDVSGKEYGPVSILIHLLGKSKKLLTLKPGSFYPAPKCNSLLFSLDYEPVCDYDTAVSVYKMAKSLFLNRRKTIYNNLSNYLQNKEKAKAILNKLGILENKRPEDISPDLFFEIFKNI